MSRPGGEPTEAPTPQRLAEARRQGQVAHSRDLGGALTLAATFGALLAVGAAGAGALVSYFASALGRAPAGYPFVEALRMGGASALRVLALPLGAAFAAAALAGLVQTGGLVAVEALRPDLSRLSPAQGLKKMFGGRAALEILKGLLKVTLVAAVAVVTIRPLLGPLVALTGAAAGRVLAATAILGQRIGLRIVLVTLLIGIADYLLVRAKHLRSLRMTRHEVKREHKDAEGDPTHRAERQRLHRELLEQRMVADVRRADFVVVNPEHIAIALRYDRDGDAAPVVVAKGERLLAERIRQVAREAGVPIFRDVTLARSLRHVQEGDEIPEALYEAVAEILRTVYGQPSVVGGGAGTGGAAATAAATTAAPAETPPRAAGHGASWKRV